MKLNFSTKKAITFVLLIGISVAFAAALLPKSNGIPSEGRNIPAADRIPDAGKEIFGMKIEDVISEPGLITVIATGSEFRVREDGVMECWQRIPVKRKVAEVKFGKAAWPFTILEKDEFNKILSGNGLEMEFSGDSLVVSRFKSDARMEFEGSFSPEYKTEKDGRQIFADSEGGFGVYPSEAKKNETLEARFLPWKLGFDFKAGEEVWLSVFPPRPYDKQTAGEFLAHTGTVEEPYSPEPLIKDAAKYAKVFTSHSFFWPGGDKEPWLIPSFVPSDMDEFSRVRDQVQENGMKYVVYASPYYSTAPDFFGEIKKLVGDYRVDGVYFDGISFDFRKSYGIIREARKIIGDDKILYLHASTDPFNSVALSAPFINTYADYILRGESGRPANLSLADFLRWNVSDYNMGNSVGYWLHYGSADPDQKDYAFNLPDQNDIDTALANHTYFPWSDTMYQDTSDDDWRRFTDSYFARARESLRE